MPFDNCLLLPYVPKKITIGLFHWGASITSKVLRLNQSKIWGEVQIVTHYLHFAENPIRIQSSSYEEMHVMPSIVLYARVLTVKSPFITPNCFDQNLPAHNAQNAVQVSFEWAVGTHEWSSATLFLSPKRVRAIPYFDLISIRSICHSSF